MSAATPLVIIFCIVSVLLILCHSQEKKETEPVGPLQEQDPEFWLYNGQSYLKDRLDLSLNTNVAKNIIIFIGDGLGVATQMATRAYLGDENTQLSFEKFPYTGLSKTYAINYQTSDSANTANAIFTGVKNNFGTLGVSGKVQFNNCTAAQIKQYQLKSIMKWAQEQGKSTGIVTTTRLTHATPAATYAVSPHRDFENDELTPVGCVDIAQQMIFGETGWNFDVMFGGGSSNFYPVEEQVHGKPGLRKDKRNLAKEWLLYKGNYAKLVLNREELLNVNPYCTDTVLGLFEHDHMSFYLEADHKKEPTLEEMTEKALEILSKNNNGYVLLVEGGRIDHAHHENMAYLAVSETVEFSKAIDYARKNALERDTLIVTTADHSHVFTVGGYAPRRNDIFGIADVSDKDHLPYLTLGYGNGMGYYDHRNSEGGRINPATMNLRDPKLRFPTAVPQKDETHGGEDVAVYASGPWSHLFVGNYEQSYIFHAMMYAGCLGDHNYQKPGVCYLNSENLYY